MTHARRTLSVIGTLAVALSALTFATAPAQASGKGTGVGSGRAIIRIDAAEATVTKTGKHAYSMVLPLDSSGQWMGERTNANDKTRLRVGDLTAQKLANKWGNFRYTKSGVLATLSWSEGSPDHQMMLVKLAMPTITDAGVKFTFTSKRAIPTTLTDLSLNLRRAPGKHERTRLPRATSNYPVESTMGIADGVDVYMQVNNATQVYGKIFDSNTCWQATLNSPNTQQNHQATASVGGSCNGIALADEYTGYGMHATFPYGDHHDITGDAGFSLKYTPSGQSTMSWAQTMVNWST